MTLREIQVEVGEWSRRNFGDQVSKVTGAILGSLAPLLGFVEEYGERCDSLTPAEANDAEADMGIYLLDFLSREGVSVYELPEGSPKSIPSSLRRLCHAVLKRHQGIRGFDDAEKYATARNQACADLFARLRLRQGFDADLEETWLKVKQRDWEKNKANAAEVVG